MDNFSVSGKAPTLLLPQGKNRNIFFLSGVASAWDPREGRDHEHLFPVLQDVDTLLFPRKGENHE
jgi:hypothetical protein